MISLPTKRKFLWWQFVLVWLISAFASLLVIPYTLTLIPDASDAVGTTTQLFLSAFASNLIVYAVVSLVGLILAARIGLGLPFLEGWLTKNPIWGRLKDVLLLAVVLGIIVGSLIIAIDTLIFAPQISSQLGEGAASGIQGTRPPPWQGLLAAISAGITEEVIFRLFVVSLLAWLGGLIFQDEEGRPRAGVMWFAIILVAVAFGLAHLPATAAVGLSLNALVVSRAIVLNGLGGIVFGWLYWRRGLESAMVCHFTADVVLHVILAAVVLRFPGLFG
jgi:membrane protease YdiL (CAAX protease family)